MYFHKAFCIIYFQSNKCFIVFFSMELLIRCLSFSSLEIGEGSERHVKCQMSNDMSRGRGQMFYTWIVNRSLMTLGLDIAWIGRCPIRAVPRKLSFRGVSLTFADKLGVALVHRSEW